MAEHSSNNNERKPRGKIPLIPKDERDEEFFSKKDEIVIDGKLVSSTANVYLQIANKFGISKQSVYLAAKRYANENSLLYGKIEEIFKEEDYVPFEYFNANFCVTPSDIHFTLDISGIGLFELSLEDMEWSDSINDILWEFSRLPCAWTFQRRRNVLNEAVCMGRCKSTECSKVYIYTENGMKTLQIIIKDYNEEAIHVNKRYTKNSHKEKVNALLKSNKACVVRAKLANEMMTDYEDYEPAHLPSTGTLRVQKHRVDKTVHFNENSILSLRMMKESPKFVDSIGDIGLDPFYCFYSTPLQRELLRVHTRYTRCVISLDASGISESPAKYSSQVPFRGEYKRTFLYVITLQTESFNIPVFQFLSQRQSSDFIQYALSCWKYTSFQKKNPNEVVVDGSSALLLSSIQCFTSCKTMENYLNTCYDSLFSNSTPPECYIRLDRAHFVKAIMSMDCLKHEDVRRKSFYRRVFGYLITVDEKDTVERIVTSLFVTLNNKYENDEFVVNAKRYLKGACEMQSILTKDDVELPSDEDQPDTSEDIFACNSKIRGWILNIAHQVSETFINTSLNNSNREDSLTDLRDNIYYAPHLQAPFVEVLVKIPLFSCIMNRAFGSNNEVASSGSTEVGYNVFKNFVLQHKSRMRLDTIVKKHLEYIAGSLKQYSTKQWQPNENNVPDNEEKENVPENISQVYEENWRGQNVDVKEMKRVIRTNRSSKSILNPKTLFVRCVPILKNGHRIIGTNKEQGILVTKTCSFDSIFQIFAACFCDVGSFGEKVRTDGSEFSKLLKNIFVPKSEVLKHRSKLLLQLFPERALIYGKNITALDCEMSINVMFMKLALEHPILQSFSTFKKCASCSYVSESTGKAFVSTNLNSINLLDLEKSIIHKSGNSICSICHSELATYNKFNDILTFDVEILNEKNELIHEISLDDICQEITLGGKLYILRGVVEYEARLIHFKAHIKRNSAAWETYDDLYPTKALKPPKIVNPVLLIYGVSADRPDQTSHSTERTAAVAVDRPAKKICKASKDFPMDQHTADVSVSCQDEMEAVKDFSETIPTLFRPSLKSSELFYPRGRL